MQETTAPAKALGGQRESLVEHIAKIKRVFTVDSIALVERIVRILRVLTETTVPFHSQKPRNRITIVLNSGRLLPRISPTGQHTRT